MDYIVDFKIRMGVVVPWLWRRRFCRDVFARLGVLFLLFQIEPSIDDVPV